MFMLSEEREAALPQPQQPSRLQLVTPFTDGAVFFFQRAHEGIKLIIAVCVGTAPLSRQRDREGDLGCAPSWLPVTVKCFPVREDGIHLSKQVC